MEEGISDVNYINGIWGVVIIFPILPNLRYFQANCELLYQSFMDKTPYLDKFISNPAELPNDWKEERLFHHTLIYAVQHLGIQKQKRKLGRNSFGS